MCQIHQWIAFRDENQRFNWIDVFVGQSDSAAKPLIYAYTMHGSPKTIHWNILLLNITGSRVSLYHNANVYTEHKYERLSCLFMWNRKAVTVFHTYIQKNMQFFSWNQRKTQMFHRKIWSAKKFEWIIRVFRKYFADTFEQYEQNLLTICQNSGECSFSILELPVTVIFFFNCGATNNFLYIDSRGICTIARYLSLLQQLDCDTSDFKSIHSNSESDLSKANARREKINYHKPFKNLSQLAAKFVFHTVLAPIPNFSILENWLMQTEIALNHNSFLFFFVRCDQPKSAYSSRFRIQFTCCQNWVLNGHQSFQFNSTN